MQNPNLNSLSCGGNNLIDLDITQNPNLELLYSFTNPLVNLDISQNTNLTHLIIPNNEIISLDLSQNENLIFFDAENNQLINLDISQNPNLLRLNVKNNQLINLNVNIGSNENLSVMIALDNPNLMCINVFDEDEANSNGCFSGGTQGWCKDASASYSENCTLGLAEINTSENITLFPNPTQNFINIKSDNPIINLKVYSMEGILLIDKNSTRINISELSSGVYFVNVSVNGRIISKKLIKS